MICYAIDPYTHRPAPKITFPRGMGPRGNSGERCRLLRDLRRRITPRPLPRGADCGDAEPVSGAAGQAVDAGAALGAGAGGGQSSPWPLVISVTLLFLSRTPYTKC